MTTQEVKRILTAIPSADVKGYSRLMGEDEVGPNLYTPPTSHPWRGFRFGNHRYERRKPMESEL